MGESDESKLLFGIDLAERRFFDQRLLSVGYLRNLREYHLEHRGTCFDNTHRNYRRLLLNLEAIYEYNENHAKSYAKRLRSIGSDARNGDAIFAEIIVYFGHLALVGEGHLHSVSLDEGECDLIVTRRDGSKAFLEVFSISPEFAPDENGLINKITHTQDAMASVRQKLLRKMEKQKQMIKARENWAVIELNDRSIAGAFTVLASLSDGYKIRIDQSATSTMSEGYDWSNSVFDNDSLRHLCGVIHFDLGNYADRRVIVNPHWSAPPREEA